MLTPEGHLRVKYAAPLARAEQVGREWQEKRRRHGKPGTVLFDMPAARRPDARRRHTRLRLPRYKCCIERTVINARAQHPSVTPARHAVCRSCAGRYGSAPRPRASRPGRCCGAARCAREAASLSALRPRPARMKLAQAASMKGSAKCLKAERREGRQEVWRRKAVVLRKGARHDGSTPREAGGSATRRCRVRATAVAVRVCGAGA